MWLAAQKLLCPFRPERIHDLRAEKEGSLKYQCAALNSALGITHDNYLPVRLIGHSPE